MSPFLKCGELAPWSGCYRMVHRDGSALLVEGRFVDRWVHSGEKLPPTVSPGLHYRYAGEALARVA